MENVFISHSAKDTELVRTADMYLKQVNINPIFAEYSEGAYPPYRKIDELMSRSIAVYLFLTQNIVSSVYTQNWVAYEVGLAHGLNKPVFVFESSMYPVAFPVPYLNNYILYEEGATPDWNQILTIAKQHADKNQANGAGFILGGLVGLHVGGPLGALIGAFAGSSLAKSNVPTYDIDVQCGNCALSFKIFTSRVMFSCPSCKSPLQLPQGGY